jgi:signal transduction histidine kinase
VSLKLRTRITLLHTGLFATGGVALLALQYFFVRQIIADRRQQVFPASEIRQVALPYPVPDSPLQPLTRVSLPNRLDGFENAVLSDLLWRSVLALLVILLVSALLGRWTSGRALARIQQVTTAAREMGGESLHDRLALSGPKDEVRELGDTFDAMLDRLERTFAARRRFAADASHELRTPLAVQRTALEIPLAQGRVPEDLQPAFRRALAANERSERLVAGLLELARGEAGPDRSEPLDLADAVREAVVLTAVEAAANNVFVRDSSSPAVAGGDPVLLAQIAVNLTQNAVRHNHPGGQVVLRTGRRDGVVFLEAANTGPEISAAEAVELFEPFRRGTAAGRATGSGLGLSIVRAVATGHGGTASAVPRRGGGLTVTVVLPEFRRGAVPSGTSGGP